MRFAIGPPCRSLNHGLAMFLDEHNAAGESISGYGSCQAVR